MIGEKEPKVLSMVDIFVKDLGIVADEARGLKCPIPLSSVALQQFTNASALGLGKKTTPRLFEYTRATYRKR